MMFKAKPASKKVRVLPLKSLKAFVNCPHRASAGAPLPPSAWLHALCRAPSFPSPLSLSSASCPTKKGARQWPIDGATIVSDYDVVVVGCGSMGSAVLFHLSTRGARVLGLEQFDVPNDLGSSVGTNRIIRLAYAEDPRYVPLLRRAYILWHELERLAGETLLVQTGGIDAGAEHSAVVTGSNRSCAEHDVPHEVLDAAALRRRFPGYRLAPGMVGVYQPHGGFLMSERCVVAHINGALAGGAEVHGRECVTAWEAIENGARIRVRTTQAVYHAKALVLTAGPWIAAVVPELRRFARPERQVMLWTQPIVPAHFHVTNCPVFNLEADEGRYYGLPAYSVPGFKIGKYHHRREEVRADTVDRLCYPEDEAAIREGIRRYFPDADGPTLAMKVCMFTNSPDEHFIIDRHPQARSAVVAAGFSGHGFKFSSVVGEILADLALDGATPHDLDLFRWNRPALRS
jgi:sarcosine oxidase